ncbi:hypothetical protein D3C80_1331740 [compost metagenome]
MQVVDHRAGCTHARLQAGQLVFDGAGLHVHVDEDEACVFFDTQLHQGRVFFVEVDHVVAVARVGQLAVELEGPGVVRAGDDVLGLAAAAEQLVAAVRADVVEGAQDAVAAAHDDDAFADHFTGDVGVVLGHFAAVADADPAAGEDVFFLVLEHCRLGVEAGRDGESLFGVGAEIGGQAFEVIHDQFSHKLGFLVIS